METSTIDLKTLFEGSPDLIAIADVGGVVKLGNPALERALGVTNAELAEQPIYRFIHPDDHLTMRATLQTLSLEQPTPEFETRCRWWNGAYRWVSWRVVAVPEQPLIYAIARDISKYKEIEDKTTEALAREKELNTLKSRFISMVSHEFRTPLSTILCSTELLEYYGAQWSREKQQVRIDRIKTAVQHLNQLLSDVLTVGRVEAGKLNFDPAPLNVEQFCHELIEDLQQSTGNQHNLTLMTNGPGNHLLVDPHLLRHILTNLLSNAIKYSPDGGDIHCEITCTPHHVTFQIQDCGVGIPPDDQAQLFTPFHRGSNVGAIAGTGLGLAIVKQCVDLHGGSITCLSELDKGTLFRVTLAVADETKTL